ncbi:MAG: ribbon-helix-helix domain-containing protein [Clostridiales bacterium]|nr:ribbon-helix-helix domain-containing protein [Clostridiales bacterium]
MSSTYRTRRQWSTAIDIKLYEKFKGLSDSTRIPATRLLDEAIEDLLVKYNVITKEEKKNP